MIKTLWFMLILSICLTFTGCIKVNNPEIIVGGTGDTLYIPNDYRKQLDSMNLSEVVSLPYFIEPFVCIAQDQQHQQFAVLFYKEDPVKTVKLPVTYEDIVKKLESEDVNPEKLSDPEFSNLHLFEINGQLFWSYSDSRFNIYMNLDGKRAYPFQN